MDGKALDRPSRRATWPLDGVSGAIERRPLLTRWILAGPGAILATAAIMMAMPLWFPEGSGGINHIALPILLAPLIWAFPFFYAILTENLPRACAIMGGATLVQGAFAVSAALGG